MKRSLLIGTLLMALTTVWAQGPNGSGTYYKNANGLKGKTLKSKLADIIVNPRNVGYDGLYEGYKKTDTRSDGYVRDWYSNSTNYRHCVDNKGSYSKEGDMYNREHSVPQSWFSGTGIKSDIVHVLPTDGYVNNRRSNYPFGEVKNATYTSKNGYCKLGSCKTDGYSGTVFEPNDEIKGDIARIYFYMITRYESSCGSWGHDVFTTTYPGLTTWTLNMMMRWSKQDPVDAREIARNNAVYEVQGNRNPYVDYPGLEEYTWGTKKDVAFSYDNYEGTVDPDYVFQPTFSPTGGSYKNSVEVTMSTFTAGASIYYTTDGTDATSSATLYEGPITLTETTTLNAVAVKDGHVSSQATSTYTIVGELPDIPDVTDEVMFYESFDECDGSGGGGSDWDDASGTFKADNDNWSYSYAGAGDECARFGSSSRSGVVTTPSITLTSAASVLTFMAAPYNVDGTSLTVEVVGNNGVTISPSSFTMTNKQWTSLKATLTGTGTIKLKFTPAKRFFLDEVLVVAAASEPTAIESVTTQPSSLKFQTYYTLDGRRLSGRPTQKGIYVHNGIKVVIK